LKGKKLKKQIRLDQEMKEYLRKKHELKVFKEESEKETLNEIVI